MSQSNISTDWHPASWQQYEASQQPIYKDTGLLEQTINELNSLPPLVTSWEIEALKEHLAAAQLGEAFLLQGGDCAED